MAQHLANFVLLVHVGFVIVVVAGLPLILIGGYRRWSWVRNSWFRVLHLAGIGVVVAQVWAGVICPLTTLEMWLRAQAGDVVYSGSFIQHWLQRLLYYDAPTWVFVVVYSAFGLLVLLSWIMVPPRRPRRRAPIP
jgi:hypothetical protein